MLHIYIYDISRLKVNDVWQTVIHRAEPLVPEPSAFDVEMATEKVTRRKSRGVDQIPAKQSRGLDNSF